jgi:hypothetical protein
MRNNLKAALLFFIILAIADGISVATRHGLGQNISPSAQREKFDEGQYPIASYNMAEPSNLQERVLRHARNEKHNGPNKKYFLSENDDDRMPLATSHAPKEQAFPFAQSDAVIVGEVKGAQAYLSADKTNVYSEFDVRIEEVIKSASSMLLPIGTNITAERPGGRVRFPSGKILLRGGAYGRNMPRSGRRYVLFLRSDALTQSFSIITGYELNAGRVSPLDGAFPGDEVTQQFADYEKYKNVEETQFLNEVRNAVFQSSSQKGEH